MAIHDPHDLTAEEARLFARHPGLTPDDRREVLELLRYPKPAMRQMMRRLMLADPIEAEELMFALGNADARHVITQAPLN